MLACLVERCAGIADNIIWINTRCFVMRRQQLLLSVIILVIDVRSLFCLIRFIFVHMKTFFHIIEFLHQNGSDTGRIHARGNG